MFAPVMRSIIGQWERGGPPLVCVFAIILGTDRAVLCLLHRESGPLPLSWRGYIGIMASAQVSTPFWSGRFQSQGTAPPPGCGAPPGIPQNRRTLSRPDPKPQHWCGYLVRRMHIEFQEVGGDPAWLGSDAAQVVRSASVHPSPRTAPSSCAPIISRCASRGPCSRTCVRAFLAAADPSEAGGAASAERTALAPTVEGLARAHRVAGQGQQGRKGRRCMVGRRGGRPRHTPPHPVASYLTPPHLISPHSITSPTLSPCHILSQSHLTSGGRRWSTRWCCSRASMASPPSCWSAPAAPPPWSLQSPTMAITHDGHT